MKNLLNSFDGKILFVIQFVILLISFKPALADYDDWYSLNPKPIAEPVKKMVRIDGTTALAMTESTEIYLTTDKGINWNRIFYKNSYRAYCCSFHAFSADHIMIFYEDSIVTTYDRFKTFSSQKHRKIQILQDVICLDSTRFIATDNIHLFKTTDKGLSWDSLSFYPGNILDIQFLNPDYGIITRNGLSGLAITEDGGKTFQYISMTFQPKQVWFFNKDTGLVSTDFGYGALYKTTDRGKNWQKIYISDEYTYETIHDISVYDIDNFCFNHGLEFAATNDGGKTFNKTMLNPEGCYIAGSLTQTIYFNSRDILSIGQSAVSLVTSSNSGRSWSKVNQAHFYNFKNVWFITDKLGFVGGDCNALLRTSDGGYSWKLIWGDPEGITGSRIRSVKFVNDRVGFFGNDYGMVFKTTDAGLTWSEILEIPKNYDMANIYNIYAFSEDSIIVACGYCIMKTTNGGQSWTKLTVNNLHYIKPWFINDSIALSIAEGDELFRTTDGGLTWSAIATELKSKNSGYQNIFFLSDSLGFLTASKNLLLRTTDAGLTWQKVNEQLNFNFYNRLRSPDNKTLYYVNDRNLIVTLDSGRTFRSQATVSAYLNDICFTKGGTAYMVGDWGVIYSSREIPASAEEPLLTGSSDEIFTPNPIRNELVCRRYREFSGAKVFVIDLFGNIAMQFALTNRNDISSLPMGMYIIRLVSGSDIYTQRMIKIGD